MKKSCLAHFFRVWLQNSFKLKCFLNLWVLWRRFKGLFWRNKIIINHSICCLEIIYVWKLCLLYTWSKFVFSFSQMCNWISRCVVWIILFEISKLLNVVGKILSVNRILEARIRRCHVFQLQLVFFFFPEYFLIILLSEK